jgi:hypothetical protein
VTPEENATKFMSSPEAHKAMSDAGLLGAPQMWFVTDGGRTPPSVHAEQSPSPWREKVR